MDIEPITENDEVVGVVLTIRFLKTPRRSSTGKTLLDYSETAKVTLEGTDIERRFGVNIYHYPPR